MAGKCSNPVRFAVVGVGGMGSSHVRLISEAEGAELVAVCDIVEERVKFHVDKYGVDGYLEYSEMLKRDDIDVINVCTPSGLHADMIIEAAKAGKHVLSEKPLDVTVEKVDAAIKACKDAGVKLGCIFQNRLAPVNLLIKETMDKGKLGKLLMANAHVYWYRDQPYYDKGGWRGTWAMDGGGALMNQSVHTIDLLQWMAGPVRSVYAKSGVFAHNIETEDLSVAVLTFENGAVGTLIGTTCAYPGLETCVELFGDKGTIRMNDNKLVDWHMTGEDDKDNARQGVSIEDLEDSGGSSDPSSISKGGHLLQIEDMARAVRENREPIITGEQARNAVAIITAVYESARTGKEVIL